MAPHDSTVALPHRGSTGGSRNAHGRRAGIPRRSFSARVRVFRKMPVISPTSVWPRGCPGARIRVPVEYPFALHAVYQAFYAKSPKRKGARRPGRHALAGFLTDIFPETRTRRESDRPAPPTPQQTERAGTAGRNPQAGAAARDPHADAAEAAQPTRGFRPPPPPARPSALPTAHRAPRTSAAGSAYSTSGRTARRTPAR